MKMQAKAAISVCILALLACSGQSQLMPNIMGGITSLMKVGPDTVSKAQETIQKSVTNANNIVGGLTDQVNSAVKSAAKQSGQSQVMPNIMSGVTGPMKVGFDTVTKAQETIQRSVTNTNNIAGGLTDQVNSAVKSATEQNGGSLVLPAITEDLKNTLSSRAQEVQKFQDTIANVVNEAASMTETSMQAVTSNVGATVGQYTAMIGDIIGKATGAGVGSCLSFNNDLKQIAAKIVSGTTACAKNVLLKLLATAKELVDEFGESIIILNDITFRAASCIAHINTMAVCIMPVWMSLTQHSAVIWTKLVTAPAALNTAFFTFQGELAGCGFTATLTSLANSAQESSTKTAKCVAQLL